MEARLSLCIVETVWLVKQRVAAVAGRAESSGCDEAWSSAAMFGREGAIRGPADWPEDPKNPQYRSRCLDGTC